MIRRPSYKQFLNQTKEVQSSINLTFHQSTSPHPRALDASQNEIKVKPSNATPAWQNKYLDVVKYIPDDPRALRHTYAIEQYGRSTINESFSKSFQMLSPTRINDQSAINGIKTNVHFRPSYRQQSKKQANNNDHPLQFTKCYVARPLDTNQQLNNSFSKGLYQSKSSTRLRPMRNDDEIEKEAEYLKQQRNRRMQNNANIYYKYEDKAKIQNHAYNIPRSTVHIIPRDDKQNRADKSIEIDKKKEADLQKERNQKSKSPIRPTYPLNDKKSYTPIQFRKKLSNGNEDERITVRQTSKSPFKKLSNTPTLSKTQSNVLSHSNINQPPKPFKAKQKKLTLQDFHLGKKLGEGRFGIVWVAIHKLSGAIFALKKISKSTIKSNFMIQQFILEVKIQSFLENPYIVKTYGIFDDEQNIFLLLEYLEGGTLYNSLKAKGKGKLTQEEVSIKTGMICEAVNCLHQKGIAHRDIKPENIMITNEICKLGDFGWATCCDQRRRTYCGTTDYVAPEIVEGLQYDMSVDLWCIGVLAYELLSGRAPFYHISRQQTFNKIKNVDTSTINYPDYFSTDTIDFIGRLIKKNPKQRMDMQIALKHTFITKYHF